MDPYGSHTVMEEKSSIFLPCVQYKEEKKSLIYIGFYG